MPKLCHEIEKALSFYKYLGYFMTDIDFGRWVYTYVEVALSSKEELNVAVEFLDSSGIVSPAMLRSCPAYASCSFPNIDC